MDEKIDAADGGKNTGTVILQRLIEDEMKQSYLDYSMSVIVGRALPDIRDGLKPVQRRILYAMFQEGLLHNKKHSKCAGVVGEVLKKFHPHGDSAVYDALVRLAQPWNLRYTLIDGQGNFGCFTADTKVKLVDGRDISFTELIEECKHGKRNFTYTIDDAGLVKVAEIKNPRMTNKNVEVMKIILDNGGEIKCTLNHKFMLKDGSYREAQYLNPNDSLMPVYFRVSIEEDDPNISGYNMILQPNLSQWSFVHVLADEWNITNKIYPKTAGRIRHHKDFNKLNNHPDNIQRIGWKEHWQVHYNLTSSKHKSSPEYRTALANGRKKFWNNESNGKAYSERMTLRNLKNWKNYRYRKQMRAILSEVNKKYFKEHPEAIEKIRERASIMLKRLWRIPKYRELYHDKIVASNKRRKTNLTGKRKFLRICTHLREKNLLINQENYEKARKEIFCGKSFTTWGLGIKKYYNNDENLVLSEINGNHKVVKTEFLKEFADVYDLTIDKTHNFALAAGIFVHNSIDGDSAAAYRYTEARLTKLAEEMLQDIEKRTVKLIPNFDNTAQEPTILPSKVPNLLVNGSSGIAVGMATNIPPHNMSEIIDGVIEQIDNPGISVDELMEFIKGPDFPTGAIIYGKSGIINAYKTGRGKVIIRAKAEIEEEKNVRKIIITEIPYMVNKAETIAEIADLVRDKKINGISDIRDESDRDGIRVVIELKKDANDDVVLNQLYSHSRMQVTFGVMMVALVNNIPKLLNLSELIHHYIEHRKEIVRKRTLFDLHQAQNKAHILEGLIIALDNLDDTIKIVKESKSVEEARNNLILRFTLTPEQSTAILEMRLQRLTSLEQEKVKTEHQDLLNIIEELKVILQSPQKILEIIKGELLELKKDYSDKRRTEITDAEAEELHMEDMIEESDCVITISADGYIKRQPLQIYKQQRRGGKGLIAATTKEEDFVKDLFIANTHSNILLFTNKGKIHWLKAFLVPEASRQARGKAIVNLIELDNEEKVTAYVPVKEFNHGHYLIMATKNGTIKKTELSAYSNPRKGGIIAISLDDKDSLIGVKLTNGNNEIILATRNGIAVRFSESKVRPTGRSAQGVRGIKLAEDDSVIGMVVANDNETLLTVTENGYGKRTMVSEYRLINRGGAGVINIICSERNGKVVSVNSVNDNDEIMLITMNGMTIRTHASQISVIGRNTQGVRLITLEEGDRLVGTTKIVSE